MTVIWFTCKGSSEAGTLKGSYATQHNWLPTAAGLFLVSGMHILMGMAKALSARRQIFSSNYFSLWMSRYPDEVDEGGV